jgi:hypothetical protein
MQKKTDIDLFLAAFRALLDNLLPLGIHLLVKDFARSLTLLPFRRLALDAHGGATARADLFLCVVPGRGAVVNFVSGGWKSVIVHPWLWTRID